MNSQSAMLKFEKNIGKTERALSLLSGSFILFNSFRGNRKFPKLLSAGYLLFRGGTGYCALNNAIQSNRITKSEDGNIIIKTSVTVDKARKEVYDFWRKLENLPKFMKHLEKVEVIDKVHSEWTMKIFGVVGPISWKSEIVSDKKNELISWISLPDSTIENAGEVKFADAGDNTTEIQVEITYKAPAGKIGEGVGQILNPLLERMVTDDIKNFKKYIETGENPVS